MMLQRQLKKLAKICFLTSLVLSSFSSYALELVDDFSSLTNADTSQSTGIWNTVAGQLLPGIQVTGWAPGAGSTTLNAGDGIHGAFELSTYASFSDGGDISGQIIRVNTDTLTELKVTRFNLASGWTLRPTGSQPLIIRSLSTVTIDGTIECSGDAGEGVYNTNYNTVRLGGTGRCGGGRGGNGGANGIAATSGTAGGSSVTGGTFGPATTGANGGEGGGGGGAYSQVGTQAGNGVKPPAAVGGARGTNLQDDAFTEIGAGSGGGGGGVYDVADANRSSGGGGGGGGGVVIIVALGNVSISSTGSIYAKGGNGGGAGVGFGKAGGGGGGGGGSIMIMSAGAVSLVGPVNAREGSAGVSDGGDGGIGAQGRTWIAALSSVTGNTDDPATQLVSAGNVRYRTGTFDFLSKSIDLRNTNPTLLTSVRTSSLPGGSTESFQVSGSRDGTTFGAFTTNLATMSGYRFIKFRLSLANTGVTTPAYLDRLVLTYDGRVEDNFQFNVTGCGLIKKPGPPSLPFWSLLFFMIPAILIWSLRLAKMRSQDR